MSTRVELQPPFSPTAGGLARAVNLESIGINVLRYALVLIFVLFGTLKFTAAEAAAIKPLVSNSPYELALLVPQRPGRLTPDRRSEEHTSELQSQSNLVCRLLLEKKKNNEESRQTLRDVI